MVYSSVFQPVAQVQLGGTGTGIKRFKWLSFVKIVIIKLHLKSNILLLLYK